MSASESGERSESAERSPTEPGLRAWCPAETGATRSLEPGWMRLVATGGIIGIAVVLGAVLVGQDVAGWIVGLAVGLTLVILAALLWSSRQP